MESSCGEPLLALPMRYDTGTSIRKPRELLSITNYYSSLYGPVFSEKCFEREAAIRALVRHLVTESKGWDILRLQPMQHEAPDFGVMAQAFRDARMPAQEYFCFGNWYLRTGGRSFQEYFKSLPSVTQNTVQRKSRKFEKSGRGTTEVISSNGPALENAIDAYDRVYRSSWKVPEPFPKFVPGLIRLCAQKGWLRLGIVRVDGEPAAAQLWIVNGGTAAIYKLAYDERYSDLSVGTILTAKLMEYVFDIDQVAEVDYLTGDDPYKQHWMSNRRERWGLLAFNTRSALGCVAATRHIGGRALKTAYSNLKNKLGTNSTANSLTPSSQP